MSCAFARIAGAMAAMALPPQIAVPALMSVVTSRPTFSKRPTSAPTRSVADNPTMV
jgi:hypothetical protein